MVNNNSSLTRPSAVAAYPRSWSWQRRGSRTGRRRGRRWRSWRVEWIVPVDLPLLSRYFSCSHPLLISVSVPTLLRHFYDSPSPVTYLPRWILGKEGGSWLFIVLIAHHRVGGGDMVGRRDANGSQEVPSWKTRSCIIDSWSRTAYSSRLTRICGSLWRVSDSEPTITPADVSCSPLHRLFFFFFCKICSGGNHFHSGFIFYFLPSMWVLSNTSCEG